MGGADTLHCAKDKSIQLTDYLTQKYSHIPLDLPFLILPLVSKSLWLTIWSYLTKVSYVSMSPFW